LAKQTEIAERRDRGRLTQQQADMFALGRFGALSATMLQIGNPSEIIAPPWLIWLVMFVRRLLSFPGIESSTSGGRA
jgi:hypothetical protein